MIPTRTTKRITNGETECRPGLTWAPPITCTCGEVHHIGARYYVSVIEHPDLGPERGNVCVALGPFLTHPEALVRVDDVRQTVLSRFNPQGRAHWYGYGTVAMAGDYTQLGRLNGEVWERGSGETVPPRG